MEPEVTIKRKNKTFIFQLSTVTYIVDKVVEGAYKGAYSGAFDRSGHKTTD